jgi:hypothetical protein
MKGGVMTTSPQRENETTEQYVTRLMEEFPPDDERDHAETEPGGVGYVPMDQSKFYDPEDE